MRSWARVGFALLGWVALLPGSGSAQVNTEALRPSGEDAGLSGAFTLNLATRRGNTDTDRLGTGLHLYHATPFDPVTAAEAERPVPKEKLEPRRLLILVGNYELEESDGERDVNKGFLHLRWTQMLSPRLGWEAFTQVERDQFTRLKRRTLLGGGLRWGAFQRQRLSLFVGAGAMGEEERLAAEEDLSGPVVEVIETVRFTSYLAFRWKNADDRVELSATIYYQPVVDDFADYRILEQARLSTAVTKRLSLVLELHVRHDADPALGVDSTDIETKAGISFSF